MIPESQRELWNVTLSKYVRTGDSRKFRELFGEYKLAGTIPHITFEKPEEVSR